MNEIIPPEEADFVRRLKAAVDGAGRVTDLAKRAGLPEKTVYNWLSGQNASKAIAFAKIAAAAGASVQSLLGMQENAETSNLEIHAEPEQADFTVIPILNVRAGAGTGVDNGSEEEIGGFPFPLAVLEKLKIRPDKVKAIEAGGPSMEPTISDGGLVLINTSATEVVDGRIYVLQARDGLLLKRMQRQVDGSILLLSDNERYKPELVSPDEAPHIKIIGHAFWTERLL